MTIDWRRRNSSSSLTCSCAAVDELRPARDAAPWPRATRPRNRPPFKRPATVRNSSCTSCSSRSAMASSRSALSVMPSSSFSFCSNLSRPRRNEAFARGARSVFEVVDVRLDGGRRPRSTCPQGRRGCADRRATENARGRSTSMNLQHAAPALESDLHEDARAFLDVVAGRLDEPRHLPQLRHDAAGALGLGRVGKQRLSREARADRCRRRAADCAPRCRTSSKLEHPRFDVRRPRSDVRSARLAGSAPGSI